MKMEILVEVLIIFNELDGWMGKAHTFDVCAFVRLVRLSLTQRVTVASYKYIHLGYPKALNDHIHLKYDRMNPTVYVNTVLPLSKGVPRIFGNSRAALYSRG